MVAPLGLTDLLVLGLPDLDDAHEDLDALLDVVIPAETHCTMLIPACDRVPAAVGRGAETRTVPTAV